MAENNKSNNNKDTDKTSKTGGFKYKAFLAAAVIITAAVLSVLVYRFYFLPRHIEAPGKRAIRNIKLEEANRTAERVALYKKYPVKNLIRFFKKTLKNLKIKPENIITQNIALSVKAPVNEKNNLKEISVDFLKYNILISKNLDFDLIKNSFRKEFKKYIIPSGSRLSYYEYSVKNNNISLYFYYKSKLFLKSVFIVRGINNSGFNSIRQYVNAPKIALDIDDVGYEQGPIIRLVSLHTPLTFAVFPYADYSKQIDLLLHKLGYETIMHTPMEPVDTKLFPGDGALFIAMDKKEIKDKILTDVKRLPFIDGANNHEGSLFTSDENKICDAVNIFKKKKLFFMDSLTDDNSYAYRCALKNGLPSAQRDVFIDDKPSIDYISRQIDIAKSLSGRFKRVIVIGHPRPDTVSVLMKMIPELKKMGYHFVPLCEFLR